MTSSRLLACPDKFKGTASAADVARSIGHAAWALGLDCQELPMADGGDGILDALGGPNRESRVTGPLGDPVTAPWRLAGGTAVIEMALASGLALVGGAEGNDALDASTVGTGEVIDHALDAGADRIIVGLGGSATTDGGFGAIRAISAIARLKRVELIVACDVDTKFLDAATVFAPQKGATPAQVSMLNRRLDRLRQMFETDFGFDVSGVVGGGAAGGLGGALAALGGRLVPGFELVADELDLYDAIRDTDLVITGEGRLDATSAMGKVVGETARLCLEEGRPVGAVVGTADPTGWPDHLLIEVVALTDLFDEAVAMREPLRCIEEATAVLLERMR